MVGDSRFPVACVSLMAIHPWGRSRLSVVLQRLGALASLRFAVVFFSYRWADGLVNLCPTSRFRSDVGLTRLGGPWAGAQFRSRSGKGFSYPLPGFAV